MDRSGHDEGLSHNLGACILTLKSVFQPRDVTTINGYYVKTRRPEGKLSVRLQIDFGCLDETLLFCVTNTCCGATKANATSVAHFYEDQASLLGHNEVDFTRSTLKVFFDERKPMAAEKHQRVQLSPPTDDCTSDIVALR